MPVRWSRLASQVLGRPNICMARRGREEGAQPPAPWTAPWLSGQPLATFSKLKMRCHVHECDTSLGSLFFTRVG